MIGIYQGLNSLITFLLYPVLEILSDYGLEERVIRVGFGSVIWYEDSLYNLIVIVMTILVWWIFVMFVYKLIKNFFKMVVGWLK